jgi:hypothetical protein
MDDVFLSILAHNTRTEMKVRTAIGLCVVYVLTVARAEVAFDEYFVDATLRVDYYHIGDKSTELVTLDRVLREGMWAGNPGHLLDPFSYGRYRVQVFDSASGRLIYSRGFDSYFGEYKTSEPAKHGVKRTFHESLLIPAPKRTIRFVIEMRDRSNVYHQLFEAAIDPGDYHIVTEQARRGERVIEQVKNGSPHDKVDIVILSEGYTKSDEEKFAADVKRYADILLAWEPYRSYKDRFNISGIFVPSPESGVDEPRQHSYKKTALDATFNSLDSDRYLLSENNRMLRDVAAQVPYDALVVMVNSKRYGGGGIYNAFTFFTSDGTSNEEVFQHEFAHAFGGLGDEYYTSDVAYDEFYPPGVEPTEPNLTALLDPKNVKWRDLLTPGLAVPTEWGQQTYDSLTSRRDAVSKEHSERVARLKKEGAGDIEVRKAEVEFRPVMEELNRRIKSFLEDHPLKGKIGAFEGGGYAPKGLYRPTVNSLMNQFTATDRTFYRVNEAALIRMIGYYSR